MKSELGKLYTLVFILVGIFTILAVIMPLIVEGVTVKLQQTVFSERYKKSATKLQGIVFSESLGSRKYFFSIDTKLGRKYIQASPTGIFTKERVDLMIEPGTKVEIEIAKTKLNQSDYKLYTDKIRILPQTNKNL